MVSIRLELVAKSAPMAAALVLLCHIGEEQSRGLREQRLRISKRILSYPHKDVKMEVAVKQQTPEGTMLQGEVEVSWKCIRLVLSDRICLDCSISMFRILVFQLLDVEMLLLVRLMYVGKKTQYDDVV